MNFLLRADASNQIGAGHLMRCLALGQMLIDDGHNVTFLTQTENQTLVERLKKEYFITINSKFQNILEDAKVTAVTAANLNADWVVTDGYNFKTDYQKVIKNAGLKLMSIDDINECHYVSDIVLNQNLNAEKIYHYSCEDYTKLLLGLKYVLLRREYYTDKYKYDFEEKCKNILITLGGSDYLNLTIHILEILEKYPKDLYINVVLGSNYSYESELGEFLSVSKKSILINRHSENFIDIIKNNDLVLTSCGSTIWEILKLGIPFLVIPYAENQRKIAEETERENISVSLGYGKNINSKIIYEYLEEPQKRYSFFCSMKNINLSTPKILNHLT